MLCYCFLLLGWLALLTATLCDFPKDNEESYLRCETYKRLATLSHSACFMSLLLVSAFGYLLIFPSQCDFFLEVSKYFLNSMTPFLKALLTFCLMKERLTQSSSLRNYVHTEKCYLWPFCA